MKSDRAEVEIVESPASLFQQAREEMPDLPKTKNGWFSARLQDQSLFVGWSGIGEFIISADGRKIAGQPAPGISREEYLLYLLGPIISFPLIYSGIEPFHASAVVLNGRGVAFLGDCGHGEIYSERGLNASRVSVARWILCWPCGATTKKSLLLRGLLRIKLFSRKHASPYRRRIQRNPYHARRR